MPTVNRERQYLQRAVALGGLVPVSAGLFGVIFGLAMTGDTGSVSADSHFRYLSGLLLGLGLCFWATIPSVEERTTLFRFLTVIVFIGGLARLAGLFLTGVPSIGMLGGLAMELLVTPLLCLWQTRVANRYADETGVADISREELA
ncbi:MAG TPA: DUF4345 domain-containing protein [Beijerinckiaceae bacterium]|jgi:hypothetical protein